MIQKITFYLLLLSATVYSQDNFDKIIYLDSLEKEVPKEHHLYSRLIKEYSTTKDLYEVIEYYRNGSIRMTGFFSDNTAYKKNGDFVYYYESGKKMSKMTFLQNTPTGNYYSWYENGNPKIEGKYTENSKTSNPGAFQIIHFWDKHKKQKVLNGEGFFEDDMTKNEFSTGNIKNGLKEGKWIGSMKYPKLTFEEYYENGSLINGNSIDSDGQKYTYTKAFTQPQPKEGFNHFYEFVGKNYRTPRDVDPSIGKVKLLIGFVVDKEGNLQDFKIIKGYNIQFENEALRVVKKYGNFESGLIRGCKARVKYMLPITIQVID